MKGVVRLLAMIALIAIVSAVAVPVLAESWQTRYGLKNLVLDDSGDYVRNLQADLQDLGYSVRVSGSFDTNTEREVKKFQTRKGLNSNGVVGNSTKIALWNEFH